MTTAKRRAGSKRGKLSVASRFSRAQAFIFVLVFVALGGYALYRGFAAERTYGFSGRDFVSAVSCGAQPVLTKEDSAAGGRKRNTSIYWLPVKDTSTCNDYPGATIRVEKAREAVSPNIGKLVRTCTIVRATTGSGKLRIKLVNNGSEVPLDVDVPSSEYKQICGANVVLSSDTANIVLSNVGTVPVNISIISLEILGNPPTPPVSGNITVDFNTVIRNLSPLAFGMDESAYGRNGQGITQDATMRARLKQLNLGQMRMGLRYASAAGETDPNSLLLCEADGCSTTIPGDAYINAIREVGAEPVIIVHPHAQSNRGNGTWMPSPKEAANMVRHYNVGTSQKVKRWIIGNEPDNHGVSVDTYASLFNQIYDAMKAVDPTIEIGGPANAYFNTGFIQKFLEISGSRVDFIDYHAYGMGGSTVLSEAQLLAETKKYEDNHNTLKSMLQRTVPSRANDIEIQVGEWNMSWSGNQRFYTHFNTVWTASALGRMVKAGSLALPYATKNGDLGALWEYQTSNSPGGWAINDYMPFYHGIAMFTGGGLFREFGSSMVNATTTLQNVEVYASNNGKNVVVINKDPAASRTANIALNGYNGSSATVWRKDGSQSPKDLPRQIASAAISNGIMSYELPPYSVTTFVLP